MQQTDQTSDMECQCQAIVNLTRQQDLHDLDNTLLSEVASVTETSNTKLYRKYSPPHLFDNPPKERTLEISFEQEVVAQLVLEEQLSEQKISDLKTLINVYLNQFELLNRINHDRLTKLGNRQAMESKFKDLFSYNHRQRKSDGLKSYCIGIFDIDHFKKINDKFGHLYGDEVLVHLAQLMRNTFRDSDFLYRYGGEEFVAILSDLELEEASKVLERFRLSVERYSFPLVGQVTLSIGLTQLDKGSDAVTMIGQADKALYYSKQNGRNQMNIYEDLVANQRLEATKQANDDITLF